MKLAEWRGGLPRIGGKVYCLPFSFQVFYMLHGCGCFDVWQIQELLMSRSFRLQRLMRVATLLRERPVTSAIS